MLGWTDALSPAGIEPLVVRQALTPEDGANQAAEVLLELDEPPTAILCFSDVMAYWVVRAAEDRGLTVPGDLSVVGFDDNPLARRMRPALTTVRQDVAAKGRAAAAALTGAIETAVQLVAGRPGPARAAADRAGRAGQHRAAAVLAGDPRAGQSLLSLVYGERTRSGGR